MPALRVPASASNGVVAVGTVGAVEVGGAVVVVVVAGAEVVVGGVVVGSVVVVGRVVGRVVGAGVAAAPALGVTVNASRRTPFSRLATTSVCAPALRFSVGPVTHVQFVRALLGTVSA